MKTDKSNDFYKHAVYMNEAQGQITKGMKVRFESINKAQRIMVELSRHGLTAEELIARAHQVLTGKIRTDVVWVEENAAGMFDVLRNGVCQGQPVYTRGEAEMLAKKMAADWWFEYVENPE